ncbi:hypothetical protein FKW77_004916 [Venturia effusa]|uniref:Uncharacterized protein n=1 Tax=Venturia effusa TaxID=50376 RepID=A0A517L5A6_9PEZI|nr:hypothetical protein FKW77_004916 [Venturia effusa]
MPSNPANPPLPPGKRTSIIPYKGKYFCCNNPAFMGIEHCAKTRDGDPPASQPLINLAGDITTSASNLVHFFKWSALYYDGTPPLMSFKEMNINDKDWFICVTPLKTGTERYFFPELGSTPFSQLTYSFLEVMKQDLTFPDKEIDKCATLLITCSWPRVKRADTDEECFEYKKAVNLRGPRAFEISIWERKDKVVEGGPVEEEMVDIDVKGKGNASVECVVPDQTSNSSEDEANSEDRMMNLKALNEMLLASMEDQKLKASKQLENYVKNEAKLAKKESREKLKGKEN